MGQTDSRQLRYKNNNKMEKLMKNAMISNLKMVNNAPIWCGGKHAGLEHIR